MKLKLNKNTRVFNLAELEAGPLVPGQSKELPLSDKPYWIYFTHIVAQSYRSFYIYSRYSILVHSQVKKSENGVYLHGKKCKVICKVEKNDLYN